MKEGRKERTEMRREGKRRKEKKKEGPGLFVESTSRQVIIHTAEELRRRNGKEEEGMKRKGRKEGRKERKKN